MNDPIQILQQAMQRGDAIRPKVGGFPYLAEAMRQAGVVRNDWSLPSCQSVFRTSFGNIALQAKPLVEGFVEVPGFDQEALVKAIRKDQAGESTFAEFLAHAWSAGVVNYTVDFAGRTVSYYGVSGESYVEEYPAVTL